MHSAIKQGLFIRSSFARRSVRVLIGFSAVFFLAVISFAQVDRSGLTGTVTDPSGRLLAGTHIMAVQNAIQLQRKTTSDSTGNYTIPALPVGTYTITVEHPGFQTLKFVDVEQVIGRTRTLNVALKVAGGEVKVEVSTISALMDRNTSAVTGLIESSAMLRLDQHFSSKTTCFMRFNYDRSVNTQPLSAASTDLQQRVSTPINGVLEVLHIFPKGLPGPVHNTRAAGVADQNRPDEAESEVCGGPPSRARMKVGLIFAATRRDEANFPQFCVNRR